VAVTARIGNDFLCTVSDAPSGLVGEITVRVLDQDGGIVIAPSTAGIIEIISGSGLYRALRTAPGDVGTYLIVWDEGDDVTFATEELYVVGSIAPDLPEGLRPEKPEVGAVIRARTLAGDDDPDNPGEEQGTFTVYTRPTGSEADDLIDQAAMEVSLRLPTEMTDLTTSYARRLISIRAATLIELAYWPESTNDENSTYQNLKQLFDEGMVVLNDALGDAGEGPDYRVGSIPVTSPTLAAYQDVYGIDLNEDLPL
jgi:hypothetical protein